MTELGPSMAMPGECEKPMKREYPKSQPFTSEQQMPVKLELRLGQPDTGID